MPNPNDPTTFTIDHIFGALRDTMIIFFKVEDGIIGAPWIKYFTC